MTNTKMKTVQDIIDRLMKVEDKTQEFVAEVWTIDNGNLDVKSFEITELGVGSDGSPECVEFGVHLNHQVREC